MSGFLLDTHIFLWLMNDAERVSQSVRSSLHDPETPVWVSAASVWEIAVKRAKGKLIFSGDSSETIHRLAFQELTISGTHCQAAADLPEHHNGSFDRPLIAQASVENLILISKGKRTAAYDVALLNA